MHASRNLQNLPVLVAAFCALAMTGCGKHPADLDPLVTGSTFADNHLADLQGRGVAVFFNHTGAAAADGLDVVTPPEGSLSVLLEPPRWRAMDRQFRFEAVVLAGTPAAYKPLAEHLDRSPDWTLSHLDHRCVIYRRTGSTLWTPEQTNTLRGRTAGLPPADRAAFLSGLASNLVARGFAGASRSALEEALQAVPDHAASLVLLGSSQMESRRFAEAVETAGRALRSSPGFPPALHLLAEASLADGRPQEAFDAAEQLLSAATDRAPALFLYARCARAVHYYRREVEALSELVVLAEKAGAPTGAYRVFLGQALASHKEPIEALSSFDAAIATGELNPSELDFATTAAARIRARLERK